MTENNVTPTPNEQEPQVEDANTLLPEGLVGEAQTEPDPNYAELKLVTVMLGAEGDLRAEVRQEYFQEQSEDETRNQIVAIIQSAAMGLSEEADSFANDPEWVEFGTPINNGSLYDELIFDVGIYVNTNNAVLANASFGKLANPEEKLHRNLKEVSNALGFIAEQFAQGNAEQGTMPTPTVNSVVTHEPEADDSVKNRF